MASDASTLHPGLRAPTAPAARWPAACVAAVLLVAIALESSGPDRVGASAAHHDRVRSVAQTTIPYSVGDWIGRDVVSAPAAVELLRPNVLINRSYENLRTGETASLLFVQCSDARDLLGHYPPVCYVSHGLTLQGKTQKDWNVAGRNVLGMRYRFGKATLGASVETVVDNFMVLPTGDFGRDMEAVNEVAADGKLRHQGVAEVQIVTAGSMSEERRDEVFRELIKPTVPLLHCVGAESESD